MRAAQQAARDAERRFPVRVRIAVPAEGLGSQLDQIIAWLDANCGADGWTSTPSSTRGVVTDALAVYFLEATIASAFVARWCATQRVEILDGVYRVRKDEPTPADRDGSTQNALILVPALPMLRVRGVLAQSTPSMMRMSRSAALPRTASAVW
jgi:hypothetical protein